MSERIKHRDGLRVSVEDGDKWCNIEMNAYGGLTIGIPHPDAKSLEACAVFGPEISMDIALILATWREHGSFAGAPCGVLESTEDA